jgi:hypothetical protein
MNDDQPHDASSDISGSIRQQEPKNLALALGLGAVVAALGGAIWALVVIELHVETGLIAWGIGLAVGATIIAIAKCGDLRLGVSAAGLALFGLILGKILIAQFGLAHSTAARIVDDPDLLTDAVYYDMVQHEEVDPQVASHYEASPEQRQGGRTSRNQLDQKLLRTDAKLASKIAHMTEDEKQAAARQYADAKLADMPFIERMGFSGWDLLWLGLAVYTAFRICMGGRRAAFG